MDAKSDTVVVTVAYPGVEKYIDDYFSSLLDQTDQAFKILIFNDGFDAIVNLIPFQLTSKVELINLSGKGISKNREYVLRYLKTTPFVKVIFADIDDTFQRNRIELVKKLLNKNDIVVNDLSIADSQMKICRQFYFSSRIADNSIVDISYICDKNIFGLSNTGINMQILSSIEFIPEQIIAVDWYIFTILLQKNEAVFTNQTSTNYRQHNSNLAGISLQSAEEIERAFNVKKNHYKHLSDLNQMMSKAAKEFEKLYDKFGPKSTLFSEYCNRIEKNKRLLWWELTNPK